MQIAVMRQLQNAASSPFRGAGYFRYRMARGKLSGDPVFAYLLEHGVLHGRMRVLDLGCGRGLLAAWFLAAEKLLSGGQWRPDFEVPSGITFHGVDLNARACAVGNQALTPLYGPQLTLVAGDICLTELRGYDTIMLLDVLHYIPFAHQDAMLDCIAAALPPDGLLILRVGNADGGWRFRFSQWVDLVVARAHGYRQNRLYCRTHIDWLQALQARGMTVTSQPMSRGTPFANVLLCASAPGTKCVK
jgi:SAM-dependent methyltransferase